MWMKVCTVSKTRAIACRSFPNYYSVLYVLYVLYDVILTSYY